MSPISALGINVEFAPGPVINKPLRSKAAVQALSIPTQDEIAPTVMETVRLVKKELSGRVPVLGFAGGPWTLAAYLVQGRGVRDFPALRALAIDKPRVLTRQSCSRGPSRHHGQLAGCCKTSHPLGTS